MKRVFHHPTEPQGGKKYWRSLDELAGAPGFAAALEREFPQGAQEFQGGEVSRRHFMKIMGASTALAGVGLAGCRRPEMHLVPFTRSAEWVIPGKFLFYTSSRPTPGGYVPVIVSTYEGRPTKIEGNQFHPLNGGTDLYTQASVLNLYDPDRARSFMEKGAESDEAAFVKFLDQLIAAYSAKQGDGLAFLMEDNPSPTRERLRAAVEAKLPMARWCVYEPLAGNAAEAAEIAFGPGVKLRPLLDKADVVLALDSDFLGSAEGTIEGIKGFTKKRRTDEPGGKINRLYAVENRYTITGGMADHRLRIPASEVGVFAVQLAAEIASATGDATLATVNQTFGQTKATATFPAGWVEELARDLVANRGRALVLAGAQQPVAVHLLVAAINSALGALGTTLTGIATVSKPASKIGELQADIKDKKVTTLFILGGNPAYDAPADLEWAKWQQSVPNVIRVGHHEDETSKLATWFVPRAHYLEYWGDGRSVDGTYVAVQPMILPLFGGWSDNDVLAKWAGLEKPVGPELVQQTFQQVSGVTAPASPEFAAAWNKFLHDGFLEGSSSGMERTLFFLSAATGAYIGEHANLSAPSGSGNFEIVFTPDFHTYDGRYNNNGWLQEAPDPVTKLTWDNAALISPATAKELGVENHEASGDMIEISLENGAKLEVPILIAPGHADRSISISLGYGRTDTGRVGAGAGYNVYPLRTSLASYFVFTQNVKPTGNRGTLAITQQHFSMEGRAFIREGTTQTFEENPTFAKVMGLDEELPKAGNPSIYTHPPLTAQEQWGMAIDLNTCTGCNACVIACQAENNSPIVGKEQVINGREMHWMRMDRYFASTDETDPDPEMLFEPLLCQQCENAPCETVCPVNATVHTPDGLNSMAYNRCIGTRYCANNCPYKVRRFNFFDYNQRPIQNHQLYLGPLTEKASPDTIKMQKNPNVTVRMRGVMEKCTFCVQRIEEARIATKVKAGASNKVKIPVDSFQVACQQACPNEAIVFGDITEPSSKVAKQRGSPRGYRLLEYLNTSPRVLYLAKIRNPNPRMPGAEKLAAFEKEEKKGGASPLTTGAGDASGGPH